MGKSVEDALNIGFEEAMEVLQGNENIVDATQNVYDRLSDDDKKK